LKISTPSANFSQFKHWGWPAGIWVLGDCPLPRGQLEDKKSWPVWPWPRRLVGAMLEFANYVPEPELAFSHFNECAHCNEFMVFVSTFYVAAVQD